MSGWSFGFNQSLDLKSEASVTEVQQPLHHSTLNSKEIDKVHKGRSKRHQDIDANPSMTKDSLLNFNQDASESRAFTFCTEDNLLNCIAYVNQDLELLGFPCLKFEAGKCVADMYFFINRLHDVLALYHKTVAVKEDLETKNHRLSCECNHHQSTCTRLRREKCQLDREVGQEKEKTRQINLRFKQVSGKLKVEKEEVKRLLSVMQSRDVQHRHDNKKREREIISLKERLHQLLADKVPDRKVGMDLRNVLSSGEGRRATWKTNQAKLEEEMYQLVVSNYEERHRELILENEDLRDCLLSLQRQLSGLLKRTESVKTVPSKESQGSQNCSTTSEVYSLEQSVNSCPSLRELDEGYMQMPFEMVRKEIERIFKETCNQISDGVQQLTPTDETNTDNMTTVTSSVGNRSFDKTEGGRRNQSVDASEVDRLKRQINNYKDIIQQQEELIQQSLHSQSQSVETTFLHESHLLKEKENLSEQKKLFFEEKSAFEKERRAFTEAASRLCKERQAFQEERARILKQHLQNASPVRDKFHLKSKGDIPQPSRMLPATPVISSSKEASGLELTTKLPLVPDNHQNSSLSSGSVTEPSAKSANNLDREGETANSSVLTVQNNPIVNFTPSSQPAQQPSLFGAAQSKADVTPKSGNSPEEAARMRIKSAAQQEL